MANASSSQQNRTAGDGTFYSPSNRDERRQFDILSDSEVGECTRVRARGGGRGRGLWREGRGEKKVGRETRRNSKKILDWRGGGAAAAAAAAARNKNEPIFVGKKLREKRRTAHYRPSGELKL